MRLSPTTAPSVQQPRLSLGAAPAVIRTVGVLGGAWLCLLTVLYLLATATVLGSDGFLGARQGLPTMAALGVLTILGAVVGWTGRRVLVRAYLWALLGIGVTVVLALAAVGHALAFAIVGWITLVAWAAGERLLKLLIGPKTGVTTGQRAVFALAVGLGALSHAVLGLGLLGLLGQFAFAGLLALLTVVLLPEIRDLWRAARHLPSLVEAGSAAAGERWLLLGLLTVAAGWLVVLLVESVAPEIQFDALYYHLALPRIFLEQGRISGVPSVALSYLYLGEEMLYLLAMGLANQTAAKLLNLVFLLLLVAAVADIGRRTFTARAGVYGAILTLSAPLFAWEASTTYVDLPLAVYCFLAAAAAYAWWRTAQPGWLVVAGILAGFALSVKLTALLALVPLVLLIGLALAWQTRLHLWHARSAIGLFSAAFALTALPWPVLQYIQSGNPVFPFLNTIFKSPYTVGMSGQRAGEYTNTFPGSAQVVTIWGIGTSIDSLLRLPWALTFETARFMENSPAAALGLGLVCLPLLAVSGKVRRPGVVAVFLFTLIYGGIWAFSGQAIRYGMPLLVPANLLAGVGLASLARARGRCGASLRVLVGGLLLIWGVASLPLYLATLWNIPERIPYAVAFGREPVDAYLSRVLATFDGFQFIRHDAEASAGSALPRTLSIAPEALRLYAPGELYTQHLQIRAILDERDPATLIDALRTRGFDYLLVDTAGPDPVMGNRLIAQDQFLDRYLDFRYASRNILVYRVPPAGAAITPKVPRALLRDGSFEAEQPGHGWEVSGSPTIDRSGTMSHSGQAAARVSPQSLLVQGVSGVAPGQLYELREASRAATPGSQVALQIVWVDAGSQVVSVSLNPFDVASGWQEHRLLVTAPAGAASAIVMATARVGEVWVDDVAFSILEGR